MKTSCLDMIGCQSGVGMQRVSRALEFMISGNLDPGFHIPFAFHLVACTGNGIYHPSGKA